MDTVKYRRNNHQHQHERIADKSLFFTKGEEIEKKIHKYYLVIALFFGVILSIWMPFFNEPDGVFHFVNSSNIVHLTTDISVYGEDSKWFGDQFANQKPAYQNGDYFKKYFETEVQKMPMSKLPRSTEYPKVLSYNFIGHLIPAIGVWAGYHIYPSMGMMIVCGRLVNMLVMTIGMFLIIKFVKRGKLLFMVVALSPVQMNLFSSLSYDATSMLLVSIFIASVINIVNRDKFTIFSLIRLCLLAAIIYLGAKTNLWLVFLFIPLLVFAYPLKKIIKSIIVLTPPIARRIFMIITIGILAVAAFYIAHQRGGFLTLIYKLFINFTYNFGGSDYSIFTSTFTKPLSGSNSRIPIYFSAVWFLLVGVAAFSETKFVKKSIISWTALAIFVLNIFALFVNYSNIGGFTGDRGALMGQIGGIQGRYITPLLPLLVLFAGNHRFVLGVTSRITVIRATIVIAVLSNAALLFDTLFTIFKF
ncbi:DUF2142 domain-containing protein [Lactococcus cremoris]|uniref:DUF2142 domain-containing protein n=1 Tax=Lactococcus lactis subsp. cremoris TaxID=1359 RepID=UPI0007AE6B50|nr:DUF2142 domain-containing protein [Lactococcus cremoris]KZK05079.1 putative membrane protein [Lactococcus cremoris]MCT0508686.1 DUF2142 domain-containing protein [Lactococcus cremoris]MDU8931166.1 hypothetical protein [Lactococcus cremoris]